MSVTQEAIGIYQNAVVNYSATGNPFNSNPGIGFSAELLHPLWAQAHLDGVCNY